MFYIFSNQKQFRFLSYSIISKPWLIVPFEIGNGVTLALMWASAASYVCLVTPQKHQVSYTVEVKPCYDYKILASCLNEQTLQCIRKVT